MVVVPQGHNNTGELFARSKPVAVTANKGVDIAGERIIITKKQAKWRSRHEGTDIAGEPIWEPQWSRPTRALDIAGEL